MFRPFLLAASLLFSNLAGAQALEHPWEPPCSYPDWPSLGWTPRGELASTRLDTGEFVRDEVDLRIAGRGLDVVIARRYRSRLGARSMLGHGWSFSYDIVVQPVAGGVTLRDGHGRNDVFAQQLDGSFTCVGIPLRGVLNGNGTYTFTFPDAGKWNLRALDGSSAQGKIASIVDRNGNAISFAYNGAGRLVTITDALARNITLAYNAAGRVASITDFAGRQVVYSYFAPGDPNGDIGDLKSVRSPVVTGTPNANDFPAGKTTSYTYAVGQPRAALDHNLLTITDPAGKRLVRNTFDAADQLVKQELGTTGDSLNVWNGTVAPSGSNGFATHVAVVNDRAGNVSERYFDASNRLVLLREFTGRATPGAVTTLSTNRPLNKLRASDPDFFETRGEFNADSLVTRRVDPELNETLFAYAAGSNVLSHFNVVTRTELAGPRGGDQVSHVWSFVYDATHNLSLQETDPRSNVTTHVRDANGNCTKTTHAIASIVDDYEFNAFGQMTAHVLPADATGFRRRDEFHYYTSGPQKGYLQDQVVDAGAGPSFLRLTTTYEYDSLGRVVRTIDPRNNDTLYDINALGQVVRERSRLVAVGGGVRYEKLFFFDSSDNLQFLDVQNVDENGVVVAANPWFRTTFEYDGLNRLTRKRIEVSATQDELTDYVYDANGNRSIERFHAAATGAEPDNFMQSLFDERDLLFQAKRAPAAMWHSTTQFDYDKNGDLVVTREGLESNPRVSALVRDGFDRVVQRSDAMGNVETLHYDANGNEVSRRLDGQLVDVAGSAGNLRLEQSSAVFDALDRATSRTRSFFDPATQANYGAGSSVDSFVFDGLGGITSHTDPTGGITSQQFDHAHRVSSVTDAKSNSVAYTYDANGNVTHTTETHKADSGAPDVVFVTDNVFDAVDRIKETRRQNGTAKCTCLYDSRNNVVRSTDELDNVTTHEFDGLSRCTATARELRVGGVGSGALLSVQLTTFVWKQRDLLASITDDNGHTTQFQYDALNRRIATFNADGTVNSQDLDVHDDPILVTDANGSQIASTFDALGRRTSRAINVFAPGVLADTTAESFAYDGRSMLVSAGDDDSLVQREHDSLRAVRREVATIGIGWPSPTMGTVTITTDASGAWTQLVCPGGRTLNATRDALHRATTLADNVGAFSVGPIDHLGCIGMPGCSLRGSRIERIAMSNNTRSTFSYDNLLRPTQALTKFDPNGTNVTRVQRTASWNADDRLIARGNAMMQTGSTSFAYTRDSLGRLAQSVETPQGGPLATITYALDDVGNRAQVQGGPDQGAYSMSCVTPVPADCQVNQYTQTPFDDRIYDANGNLRQLYGLGAAADLASYDFANRLGRYVDTSAGQVHLYKYDALGRRMAKIVDSTGAATETRFFYCGDQVLEEQNKLGATLATYVGDFEPRGNGFDGFEWGFGVMSMRRGATNYFFHHDAVGNVAAVTNGAGGIAERYEYEDFGKPRIFNAMGQSLAQSAIGNPHLSRGDWLDSETGLHLRRDGRFFDPRSARTLQRGADPSGGDVTACMLRAITAWDIWRFALAMEAWANAYGYWLRTGDDPNSPGSYDDEPDQPRMPCMANPYVDERASSLARSAGALVHAGDISKGHFGDIDGDGTPDWRDFDTDGDGVPNSEDWDSDGDGIANGDDNDSGGILDEGKPLPCVAPPPPGNLSVGPVICGPNGPFGGDDDPDVHVMDLDEDLLHPWDPSDTLLNQLVEDSREFQRIQHLYWLH